MSNNTFLRIGFSGDNRASGLGDLRRRLERLGDVNSNQSMIDGMRQAGGILRHALRASILSLHRQSANPFPTHALSLWASVTNSYKRGKAGELRIIGFKRTDGYHGSVAHLFDRGTGPRYTRRGFYRGVMPRTDFVARTIANNQNAIALKVSEGIKKALKEA